MNRNSNYSFGKSIRKELTDLAVGIAGLAIIGTSCVGPLSWMHSRERKAREAQSTALWEEYAGTIPDYTVEISDSDTKNGYRVRIVHLDGTDESIRPNRITGHDYNRDGTFDRVFIMNEKFDSCDSVYFTPQGNKWDPSPASEREGKRPFSEEQIVSAQRKLYEAVDSVKTEANKYRHWMPGMGSEQNHGLLKDKRIN